MSTIPTIEERDSIITENLYFRQVLLADRASIGATIESLIPHIPQEGAFLRLEDFCDLDYLRRVKHPTNQNVFNADWDVSPALRFQRAKMLNWFHQNPSLWPVFKADLPVSVMEAWTDMLTLAPEADRVLTALQEAESKISDMAWVYSSTPLDTRDLHGWYVTVNTGRRQATGWVVGGRGATLHVVDDPMGGVRGDSDDLPSLIAHRAQFSSLVPGEPLRFSRKTTNIQLKLILPPEMAVDRRQWLDRLSRSIAPLRTEAAEVAKEWEEWAKKAEGARAKKASIDKFVASLPAVLTPKSLDRSGYVRYITAGEQILNILFNEFSGDRVREMVIEDYLTNKAGGGLTEADVALLAEEPASGASSVQSALAKIIRAKADDLNLTPEF